MEAKRAIPKPLKRAVVTLSILLAIAAIAWTTWRHWWSYDMLIQAVRSNDVPRARLLIDLGAKSHRRGPSLHPLFFAVSNRDPEMVEMLSGRTHNLNFFQMGSSALMQATAKDYPEIARVLLQAGADPDCGTEDGMKPLEAAMSLDHPEVAMELLAFGADPDTVIDGQSILDIWPGLAEIVAEVKGERAAGGE